ncbi:hypothetical protein [Desulfosporosinus hippei]|uniref:Uncharacterized protein n=1 Tax=Desulfosporosinus hippei DSM 8344 TaxID=1121419 RepID=A0A1G7VNX5_9FIRM|nr:hypothetical protein [Desulfosporosinus hippei]SDG61291.1 hypothetical protein SAMN05443529_104179 [Desulfosporosinus hippei DSM 8344]
MDQHDLLIPDFQIWRCAWEINAHDDDHLPSIPHGHCIDKKRGYLKLNVFTGAVIDARTNDQAGTAKAKDISRLHKSKAFRKIVMTARQYHAEHFPYRPLPPLPAFAVKITNRYKRCKQRLKSSFTQHEPILIFSLKVSLRRNGERPSNRSRINRHSNRVVSRSKYSKF